MGAVIHSTVNWVLARHRSRRWDTVMSKTLPCWKVLTVCGAQCMRPDWRGRETGRQDGGKLGNPSLVADYQDLVFNEQWGDVERI